MHTHSYTSAECISRSKTARPLSMCISINITKEFSKKIIPVYISSVNLCCSIPWKDLVLFFMRSYFRGNKIDYEVLSVQFSSVAQSCLTLCDPMNPSTPGLPVHHQLLEFTSIESVMPSSHLTLCCPLLLLSLIPSSIRVFSNESTLHMRWPKYWSFSFSIIPSKEIPGLIFRMDCLDPLAVQGTLKSLLQHHSSKASILRGSVFFTVQLSHPYMTTGKTIAY